MTTRSARFHRHVGPPTSSLTGTQGGTIAGSINLPAQSLYPSLPTVYNLVKAAGIPRVIWYCGMLRCGASDVGCLALIRVTGSSRGRGTRAAAWFADILAAEEDCNVESLILTDGVAGWASAGEEFAVHMHEYDASKWISRTLTSSRSKVWSVYRYLRVILSLVHLT